VIRLARWVSLAAVLGAALAACGSDRLPVIGREPLPAVGTEIGALAPPLAGTRADGSAFELRPARREYTLVEFYRGERCGLCRERLAALEANREAYEAARVRIIAVTLDEPEVVAHTAEALGLGFPVASADSAAFARWAVLDDGRGVALPASLVLDERGVIRYRHLGHNAADRADDAVLLAIVGQLRAGPAGEG
jgi:peroxiredoxin